MKITDIRATTVTVPLEAPLRHANGCHWGRFVRTLVEVETDNGLVGLGEMGGGGESAEAQFRAMKAYLLGHDPARLEEMRFLIANPTASLVQQPHADSRRARVRLPRHSRARRGACRSPRFSAAVCATACRSPRTCSSVTRIRKTGEGEVRTIEQVLANAHALKQKYGFTTHKVKAGVFHPDHELDVYRAVAAEFPNDRIRYDCNAVWSTEQAIRFGQGIEGLRNDYLEDPVYGMHAMRRVSRDGARAAGHQYGGGGVRATRGEYSGYRRGCHSARHDVLGRHPAVRQSGGRLRDFPDRRRGALIGRVRRSTRNDAAPGSSYSEFVVRGRRALSPLSRRRD